MRISETFSSLQGEGPDAGVPALFIRLTGCNVRCSFCDTAYAFSNGMELANGELIDIIRNYKKGKLVVVTGGEPLIQQEALGGIINSLDREYRFAVETNGTLPRPLWWRKVIWDVDCKCPSSGVFKFDKEWLAIGQKNRLKFVVSNEADLEFTKACIERARQWELCPQLIISPMTPNSLAYDIVQNRRWMQKVWTFCVENNVRYSLQLHKVVFGSKAGI